MAVFEKTYQAVKEFESSIKAAQEAFRDARKEIMETYKDPVSTKKLGEAREILTQTEQRETLRALDAVEGDFASVNEKIMEIVTRATPVDFPATLAAIQAKGDKVSSYEANAFLQKYGDNYLAISTLLEVLHSNNKADSVHITTAEMMDAKLKALEEKIVKWIRNRHGVSGDNEYTAKMLVHETHSPILLLAAEVQSFLDGNFIRP